MGDWTDVARADEIGPGENRVADVDGAPIAVFNLDGEFYAIEDVCTHDGAEIASGCLVGDAIECPRHAARFSVKTGEVLAPPAYEPVATLPVRVENGMVQVKDERWD